MYIKKQELGYREVNILADLMKIISENGIPNDVAKCFYYDYRNDCAVCETENGTKIEKRKEE